MFTLSVLSSQGLWSEQTGIWIDFRLRFCQEEGIEVRELVILTKVINRIDREKSRLEREGSLVKQMMNHGI